MKKMLKRSLSLFLAITIIFGSAYAGFGELDFNGVFTIRTHAASVDDLTFELNSDNTSYSVTDCVESAEGEIIIPSNYNNLTVTSIGYEAFRGCDNLTSVTIPDSVTNIGNGAFSYCDSLVSFSIGNGVTSIGDSAFWDCKNLTSITIPDSVTYIGGNAFHECTNLTDVHITDIAKWCAINFGDAHAVPFSFAENLYCNGELVTDLVIPDGVTTIKNSAFAWCESLTSVTISDSVTSIEDYAFFACNNITSVTFPDSVTSIGEGAFGYCDNLNSVYITDIAAWCAINSSPFYTAGNLYLNGELVTDLVIPDGITTINDFAFQNCINITSVTIPDSVTSIGEYAFQKCKNITSVTIPDSVTSIGEGAFYSCTSLESVIIPDSVTSIGEYAFSNCSWLDYVFYTGSESEWSAITIGDNNLGLTGNNIHFNATDHTISDWIIDYNATVFYPGYKYKECTVCGKLFEGAGIPQLKPATPKLTAATRTASGVKVSWGAVSGADKYIVYRKTSKSGWTNLGSTTSTSFTDTKAKTGTTYYYTVKAQNEAGESGYNKTGLKIKYVAAPKLTKIANESSGVRVSWSKVSGADGYYLYRRVAGTSSWTKVATIKKGSTTSYLDKKASGGKTYEYIIKAYDGSTPSAAAAKVIKIKRLASPKISSASSKYEGVLVKWNKVTGASGYYVYRKASSGEWKRIATVKGNTKVKYLDETPRKGATYQYIVKAYSGSYTSGNSNAYKIKCKY